MHAKGTTGLDTAEALAELDNEQIIDVLDATLSEVIERLNNYAEATDSAMALLDGVRFATAVRNTLNTYTYGRLRYGWDVDIESAQRTLTDLLGAADLAA